MRIAILGAGRIGESLLAGLRSSDWADIVATSRREERAAELRERHGVEATTSNEEAIRGADVIVLAVKPQDIEILLGQIGHLIEPGQTVVSVAAAITTARIERHLQEGVAVVMLSTEVDELLELMDRVLVFREHELFTELARDELKRERLVGAFFGGGPDDD